MTIDITNIMIMMAGVGITFVLLSVLFIVGHLADTLGCSFRGWLNDRGDWKRDKFDSMDEDLYSINERLERLEMERYQMVNECEVKE